MSKRTSEMAGVSSSSENRERDPETVGEAACDEEALGEGAGAGELADDAEEVEEEEEGAEAD